MSPDYKNNEKKDENKSYAGTDKGKQIASSVIGGHNCSITCRKHCNRNIGGGGKKVETAVPKKDIKAAREAAELSDEGEVQTVAIDKDIIVNAGGTGSADAKSGMQDSQTTEDSQTVQNTEDYIFPNSSSVLLTDAEVSGISKDQLRIGRNEILARHGRRFNDQALQQYFDSKSWYNGTISPDEFDANLDSRLNDVERANIEIIKKYE